MDHTVPDDPTTVTTTRGQCAGRGRPVERGRPPTRPDGIGDTNVVIVAGTLSSDPRVRELPSGSELRSYEVTTTDVTGARRTVPVVWFDPRRPARLHAGDAVVVAGAVRRRFFRAGGATVSRTEVVADTVARAGSNRAKAAVGEARRRLDTHQPLG